MMISSAKAMSEFSGAQHAQRHTSCGVAEDVARGVKVFPDDERLDRAKIECFQGIIDTKAVLASVLANFVEVFLDEPLLLYEFDVG